MSHLKRLLAPSFWKVSKKESKWVVTPRAGPHPKFYSIPLSIILKNILKIVDTTTEAKQIINKGEILVDGKRRKDHAYPVGLFDVISIPRMKKYYRIISNPKGLAIIEIDAKESNSKICKINKKTIIKKGKVQLNLHDGKNVLVDNGNYKTGDSLLVELPSLKVLEHLSLQQGNIGLVSKGTNAGKLGKIKKILQGAIRESSKVLCEINKEDKIIGKDSFVVVGKEKPVIKLSE